MTKVNTVENVNPKMIVQANMPQKSADSDPKKICGFNSVNIATKSMLKPTANGIRPKTAAEAVNNTGVKRMPPPSIIASFNS